VRPFAVPPLHAEFRLFVHARRPVAASQLFAELCFPELRNSESWLRPALLSLANRLLELLPAEYDSFVADVIITQHESKLIELNPVIVGSLCVLDR
jgi:hypothetical protein